MAQTAGGTYYAASSELVSSWPATSLDLANQLESRFAAKANLASPTFTGTVALPAGSTIGGTAISTFVSPTWTSFTPTWTNATVGNGSTSGFYCLIGKSVRGFCTFTLGSTSSVSNNPRFAAPYSSVSGNMPGNAPVGFCAIQDTGVTVFYGVLTLDSGAFRLNSQDVAASDAKIDPVTSTNPMTWTNTDSVSAWFQYQID